MPDTDRKPELVVNCAKIIAGNDPHAVLTLLIQALAGFCAECENSGELLRVAADCLSGCAGISDDEDKKARDGRARA